MAEVEVATNVEGASVEVVVVPELEAEVAAVAVVSYENRAGMSHSRSSATQTHNLSVYLQRVNPLLSTLALPTLPRTD